MDLRIKEYTTSCDPEDLDASRALFHAPQAFSSDPQAFFSAPHTLFHDSLAFFSDALEFLSDSHTFFDDAEPFSGDPHVFYRDPLAFPGASKEVLTYPVERNTAGCIDPYRKQNPHLIPTTISRQTYLNQFFKL